MNVDRINKNHIVNNLVEAYFQQNPGESFLLLCWGDGQGGAQRHTKGICAAVSGLSGPKRPVIFRPASQRAIVFEFLLCGAEGVGPSVTRLVDFRLSAAVSRDGLVESCTCCYCGHVLRPLILNPPDMT